MNRPGIVFLLSLSLIIVSVSLYGCGGGGSGGGGGGGTLMTSAENEALMQDVFIAISNGISSAMANSASPSKQGQIAQAACGTTMINYSGSFRQDNPAGGYMSASASVSGSYDSCTGSGMLTDQVDLGIYSWYAGNGITVYSDPLITAAGTYSFLSNQLTLSIGGAWTATNGVASYTCSINLTAYASLSGSASISGTLCGNPVNVYW